MKMTWDGTGLGEKDRRPGIIESLQKSAARGRRERQPDGTSQMGQDRGGSSQDGGAIEPAGPIRAFGVLRLLVFIVVLLWVLASIYKDPMFASAGQFLIVSHPVKKADVVVCLSGNPVERGLEALELVGEGYAPLVFIPREQTPEGLRMLQARGVDYPETRDLVFDMLKDLGLPPEALVSSDTPAVNTAEEAVLLRDVALAEGYERLIVVTSPHHTRRAWVAFRHAFKDTETEVIMRPSRFSDFQADNWWKQRRYAGEVILEYVKLGWYMWAL